MLAHLKRSVHLKRLFDPVLHSSFDDLVITQVWEFLVGRPTLLSSTVCYISTTGEQKNIAQRCATAFCKSVNKQWSWIRYACFLRPGYTNCWTNVIRNLALLSTVFSPEAVLEFLRNEALFILSFDLHVYLFPCLIVCQIVSLFLVPGCRSGRDACAGISSPPVVQRWNARALAIYIIFKLKFTMIEKYSNWDIYNDHIWWWTCSRKRW